MNERVLERERQGKYHLGPQLHLDEHSRPKLDGQGRVVRQ
jgi:hypothetical protein